MYRMTPAPVRRVVGLRGLGALGEQDISIIFDKLTSQMKKEAMIRAGAQMGISIALNFIPVIGTAASLVMAAVSTLVGGMYERAGKEELASFQVECNQLASQADLMIQKAQNEAVLQEKDAAIQLAMSSDPLSGLGSIYAGSRMRPLYAPGVGDIWSSIKDTVQHATQVATNVVVRAAPAPVVKAATSVIKAAESVGSRIDSDLAHKAMNPLVPIRQIMQIATPVITELAREGAQILPGAAGDAMKQLQSQVARPLNAVKAGEEKINTGIDVVSGRSGLDAVREAIAKGRALVIQQLGDQVKDALAIIASPQYRQQLRVQLAQMIRQNMAFTMLQPTPGSITAPSIPTAPKAAVSPLAIGAAAAAAFLFFSH